MDEIPGVRLVLYTRSGAAFKTLTFLHILSALKTQATGPRTRMFSSRSEVIMALCDLANPIPSEVLQLILEFLFIPLIYLPELFHRNHAAFQAKQTSGSGARQFNQSALERAVG